MLDISVDMFGVDRYVKGIFDSNKITGSVDIIATLEKYQFVKREKIISVLVNKDILETLAVESDEVSLRSLDIINRLEKYRELEERFGVLINDKGKYGIEIVAPLYHDYNGLPAETLELKLKNDHISTVFVTPVNFWQLAGDERASNYDPIIMFKRLVLECVYSHATDLHITVHHVKMEPVYLVQYRRDGLLCNMNLFEMTKELNEKIVFGVTSKYTGKNPTDLLSSAGITSVVQDVFNDDSIELRISISKVLGGYNFVGRIQNRKTVSLRIHELGFPLYLQNDLMRLTRKRSGITFITGPIRTGKNTTAFALANELVKQPLKINSYESPIEAVMEFPQSDYLGDPKRLADLCRLAKKQDVNVAFLNEIPNKEVAFAVKDLVNSSIYVITTIHIDRIWHLPFKLSEYYGDSYKDIIAQINGVVNQKMCGIKCPHCQSIRLTSDLKDPIVREFLLSKDVKKYAESNGCAECIDLENDTFGLIKGRNQPFAEYLLFSDDLKRELLACKEPYQMSDVLKRRVEESGHTLENEMSKAVADYKIDVSALDLIL